MACIHFEGHPTISMEKLQVIRIGSNKLTNLDVCLDDESVAQFHATITYTYKTVYLVNETDDGKVLVNDQPVESVTTVTYKDAIDGSVKLQFGNVEAKLCFLSESSDEPSP
ncbi:uncharacterized protein LOC115629955 [Scaptodrosophila lebanonensis]|uniref:Uncharacterized protein LOC115629955 n=1 Tax=Drosophila lebanonensis TaxID=7225 RepID=A0A6J2U5K9_DROLE|nr:uncharacterized protein LOC115629955 [Scaptodrosophila lebanonensis]XP_030382429.1 uncharacterized protein LOC115629955 [Scaptodrosophila lebanonensis]